MTDAAVAKKIIADCPEKSCIRCRYGYVTDDEWYESGDLLLFNLHTCCRRTKNPRHCGSFVLNWYSCDDFEPASCIFVFPPVTDRMRKEGRWWSDKVKEQIEIKAYTLDRWMS